MSNYYQHIQEKRHNQVNTPEYDDWLEKLLTHDTTNVSSEHLWVDCDLYYLYMAPQGSQAWKDARKGRVTGSVLSDTCSSSKYSNTNTLIKNNLGNKFDKLIDLNIVAEEINGIRTKQFSDFAINVAMAHGTKTEPLIREYHSKYIKKDIIELPIAIPKWNMNIGVSIDAYIKYTNIIGEYKAPQKLYDSLVNRLNMMNSGLNTSGYDHIVKNHYYQMMMGMKIFDKKFCDYVVYDSVRLHKVYMERIPFNSELWDNTIEPKLNTFINDYLIPTRPENYPMLPLKI